MTSVWDTVNVEWRVSTENLLATINDFGWLIVCKVCPGHDFQLSIVCRLSDDGGMKRRATINTCCCIIDWRVDIDPAILLLDSLPCDELPLCLDVLLHMLRFFVGAETFSLKWCSIGVTWGSPGLMLFV